jgi:hypothetical protein
MIFSELGWNYTFNGVKGMSTVFVPKSHKGIIRKESPDDIAASVNGVISTLGLAPMTIEVSNFNSPVLIVAPSIIGQVLDDAGVPQNEIEMALANVAANTMTPAVPTVAATPPMSPAGSSASHSAMTSPIIRPTSIATLKNEQLDNLKDTVSILATKIDMLTDVLLKSHDKSLQTSASVNIQPVGGAPVDHPVGTPVVDITEGTTSTRAGKAKAAKK